MMRHAGRCPWFALCVLVLVSCRASAQELEPRAYSPSPTGTTFFVAGVGRSVGGVLFDPSLPFEDVEAELTALSAAVGYTFGLFGRQALLLGALPYAWGNVSGQIGEDARQVTRSGLADPRVKLSVNLAGAPALTLEKFARAPRKAIVGASLTVSIPAGEYNREKLINLGAHRWGFKPEIGVSQPLGRWTVDGYAAVWLFTTNETFYPGSARRAQDPIVSLQGHVSYMLTRRAWLAFDGTWYSGGQTELDGVAKSDFQRNSRVGATLSMPLTRQQSLKFSYSTGATTRVGGDFDTYSVAWQLVRF